MPAMLLSKEDWKEVRRASEAGVDDPQLSKDYGVSQGAIRVRKMREKWLTPRKLAEQVAIAKVKQEMRNHTNAVVTAVTKPAEESISERMLNSAELIGSQIMSVLERKAALVYKNPGIIDDPETVGDLGTMVNVSRKIAGLDKPEANASVALNFGAFWQAPDSSPQSTEKPVEKARVVDCD